MGNERSEREQKRHSWVWYVKYGKRLLLCWGSGIL